MEPFWCRLLSASKLNESIYQESRIEANIRNQRASYEICINFDEKRVVGPDIIADLKLGGVCSF